MFNAEFFPTPAEIGHRMLDPYDLTGKVVLEPSAGKGDLVRIALEHGASEVLACEIEPQLRAILNGSCRIVAHDFMDLAAEDVSHISCIVMNPPFSKAAQHIKHAFEVAPPGCHIVALCNNSLLGHSSWRAGSSSVQELVNAYGSHEELGKCFTTAERTTDAEVALVRLRKPGIPASGDEYEGFFLGPDEVQAEGEGLIRYSYARDIVNRFVEACRVFDEQIDTAVRLQRVLDGVYGKELGMQITQDGEVLTRSRFRRDLQKDAWKFVIAKANLEKYATQGLRSDLNAFVEQQTKVPFTMRNIYRMVEIIIGTQEQRIDRAVEDVFDRLTRHYKDNRWGVEGWCTNSQYLFNQRLIMPYICEPSWTRGVDLKYNGNSQDLADLMKSLCFLTGRAYEDMQAPPYGGRMIPNGELIEWGFFECRFYKKGTGHFKFKDKADWKILNRRIAKIKGMVLPEKL